MYLHDLLNGLVPLNFNENPEITGFTQDSRQVKQGDLFCAYPGLHSDGRAYIKNAIERGAGAILMEPSTQTTFSSPIPIIEVPHLQAHLSDIAARFYEHPSQEMTIIGVTGTNGKTSCTHFIANCLAYTGQACGIIGGMGNGIYYPNGQYQPIEHNTHQLTTPDAISLQRILRTFLDEGARTVALEASSHGITQGRLDNVRFTIAAFTNLSRDHLDYHKTLESYAEAKQKLFKWPQLQYAIFNQDDAYSEQWQSTLAPYITTYTYGIKTAPSNQLLAKHCSADPIQQMGLGLSADITTPWGPLLLNNHYLSGEFNCSNLLLAITALGILGIPLPSISEAIHQLKPIKGRMERLKGTPTVIIDYAHTPDALQRALESIPTQRGQLWCLFGCGGNRDRGKRPLMGKIAARYAHHIIITDDNPRHEASQQIIEDICVGLSNPEKATIIPDRKTAIQYVIQQAQHDDIILIAGKGHETYQLVGDQKLPFSDHAVASAMLKASV